MESIKLADTGRVTSRLGYGCSTLMGATGRQESLALLEHAFDSGIRHFDVAPMYGFGSAEGCLGEFVSRHRSDVTITTKYGIPPARNQSLVRVARRIVGPVLKVIPGFKKRLARAARTVARPVEAKSNFTVVDAATSLEHSLSELKRDRIDIWLLHEAEVSDLSNPDLLRYMQDAVSAGKIGTFGVGSNSDKIPALLSERPLYCPVLQFEWSALDRKIEPLPAFTIHHRALTEEFHSLYSLFTKVPDRCRRWSISTDKDLGDIRTFAGLMLKISLTLNPNSIILFSSRDAAHITENVRVSNDASLIEPALRLYSLIQNEGFLQNS